MLTGSQIVYSNFVQSLGQSVTPSSHSNHYKNIEEREPEQKQSFLLRNFPVDEARSEWPTSEKIDRDSYVRQGRRDEEVTRG